MLSYLVAVEIENLIEKDLDFKKQSFDIEVLMKNMNQVQGVEDKRKRNERFKYCVKIEGARIKLANFQKNYTKDYNVVSLPFSYSADQECKIRYLPDKMAKKIEIAMDDSYLTQHITFVTGTTHDNSEDDVHISCTLL